jgi:NAD(P)-dependent dehydrogenase (short-subunit alcohol dehydrogenase family)
MTRTAVVAGVGPGLGASVARRFAAEGLQVALLARTESYLTELAAELDAQEGDGTGLAVPTELAAPDDVARAFESVREAFGRVDVLVYNASAATWDGLLDCEPAAFDRALAVGVRGAFECARAAVSDMLADAGDADGGGAGTAAPAPAGETRGVVVFTGATTSVRGRRGAVGFSAAKFGARGLAESMARELGPRGVHVAHVVIDGGIRPTGREVDDPEAYLDPDAVADAYWHLVEQDRSAWTLELDLRPHVEEF